MTTTSVPFAVRSRGSLPARHLPSPLNDFVTQTLARAELALGEPFVGITSAGQVEPGLFSLHETGVSTRPILEAAEAFQASMAEADRAASSFALDDSAWQRWNNTHPFTMRHGVLLESLSATQRERALDVVRASLSRRGFAMARDIMKLNETIGEMTQKWADYGEWLYWLSIFGTPSLDQPWGWQIDGHHLNLHCLVLRDQVVMTPMFMGSEPTFAPVGAYAGTRVFDAEEQQALAFMNGLSEAQRSSASMFPREHPHVNEGRIQGGAQRDNQHVPYAGLRADALSAGQRAQLLEWIDVYVGRLRPGHDHVRLAEIQSHLERTYVAWSGGMESDSTFYYRIHSPVVLIEFDHLRGIALANDVPARTHIHTVMRTPNGNDYGKDLLRQHYARFAH